MKMKRLFTLAVLLASSLASAKPAPTNVKAGLKEQYYAGVNLGAGMDGNKDIMVNPGIVGGYHYDDNSKLELEIMGRVGNVTKKGEDKTVGANIMFNYCYYPELDTKPVQLYVSGGIGGCLQIMPSLGICSNSGGGKTGGGTEAGGGDSGTVDPAGGGGNDQDKAPPPNENTEEQSNVQSAPMLATYAAETDVSMIDKILNTVAWKVKLGVEYEINKQIVVAGGVMVEGTLAIIKAPKLPAVVGDIGVRYNF
ncbi:outer membrane beta-barrel protein [Wolbachia endosymbiont of Ctenocephalides felis wCfeT]|uniref:outer membrane beta-barrel protein n=1 Tax=Wolbachia endosymbiont of Ctenocephalides felis wCfeT TaxID=2732593 RepID=UPI0014471B2F|nr:outer membrane beta-barrel protein [Wolbachia endosymbiont of Ctenocephalides felis wCfeT]